MKEYSKRMFSTSVNMKIGNLKTFKSCSWKEFIVYSVRFVVVWQHAQEKKTVEKNVFQTKFPLIM